MANNYMFLCYKPTGRIICLGKRMGYGWYCSEKITGNMLNKFYEECEKDSLKEDDRHQDDFCLLLEDDEGFRNAYNNEIWQYDTSKSGNCFGFVKFIKKKENNEH